MPTSPQEASALEPASGGGTGPGRVNVVAPDGGCLCYVLRTGFSSSQGELMQMIEFSTQQVRLGEFRWICGRTTLTVFACACAERFFFFFPRFYEIYISHFPLDCDFMLAF